MDRESGGLALLERDVFSPLRPLCSWRSRLQTRTRTDALGSGLQSGLSYVFPWFRGFWTEWHPVLQLADSRWWHFLASVPCEPIPLLNLRSPLSLCARRGLRFSGGPSHSASHPSLLLSGHPTRGTDGCSADLSMSPGFRYGNREVVSLPEGTRDL